MENALLIEYNELSRTRKAADVFSFLENYIAKRESIIAEIEEVIDRYTKRRMLEEQAMSVMSPLRRMLSGRKPDHHLAVEYIHYVKKPRQRIRHLREEIEEARRMMKLSSAEESITSHATTTVG